MSWILPYREKALELINSGDQGDREQALNDFVRAIERQTQIEEEMQAARVTALNSGGTGLGEPKSDIAFITCLLPGGELMCDQTYP